MEESLSTFVNQNTYSIREKMEAQHTNLDMSLYLKTLFEGVKIANIELLELADYAAFKTTGNTLTNGPRGAKSINRVIKTLTLARLFESALKKNPDGNWIECGVWRGYSGLIFCQIAKQLNPDFDGSDLYLLDSFQGLSEKCDKDIGSIFNPKSKSLYNLKSKNEFRCSLEQVNSTFNEFDNITLIKGWIPEVFDHVPDKLWSFVHIDVDLYEPTFSCLEYFYDRLLPGGIMVCDDYITPLFPGAMKAWDSFCEQREIHFAILDSGQSLIIKDA